MPSNNDGRVVINIDSNASKVARDFQNLTNDTAKYERILRNVAGTSNSTLPIYDKIRAKLKEQQAAANSAIASYQKLANAQKSGIGFSQLNSVTGSAIERLKNLALQGRQNSTEFQNLAKYVKTANKELTSADNIVNKAIGNTQGLASSFLNLNTALGALSVGYVTNKIIDLGKSAVNTSMDFQALENRMNAAASNKSIGADSLAYIREQADRLGLEFRTTADSFAGFEAAALRSGLTLEQTKQIFTDVSTAATSMQLSTEKVQLVFKALEQISGKGTVSMEELRQQLGDSLPGAFEIAAQSMGMTTKAFYDAVANGEVLSSEFLPKFAKAVREQLGGSAEEASTQLRASLNRLNTDLMDSSNAWGTLLQPSVQKGVEAFRGAAQASTQLANTLNQNQAQIGAVATSVGTATTAFIALRAAAGVQLSTAIASSSAAMLTLRNSIVAATTAMMSNPYFIGAAAIAAGIGGITYALQKNQVELSKTTQKLKELANETVNNATETPRLVAEYGKLASASNRTGEQEQRLIEIREKLNAQYPDLLAKFNDELSVQGQLKTSTAELIAQYIRLAEVRRLEAQQREAEEKYNKAVSNKWYWNENSLPAVNNRIKAMEEYNTATNATIKALRALNAQSKAAAKVIQERQGANDYSLAPSIGNIGSSGGSSSTQKQKDAYERLQEAAKNARREVELNAIAYGTSSPQVQQAFKKYRNLNTQLNDINKLFEENTKKAKENGGAYKELQQKINDTRNQLLNMAVSGQGDTAQFTMLKNTLKQYETQAQQANTAVTNSVGLSWKNISNTISSQLSYALTTPLQEGENAFERLGNVALNVISQIAQAWLSNSLNNLFSGSGGGGKSSAGGLLGTIGGLAGSFFGPIGSAVGGFFGNTIGKLFNANGNAFVNGHLQPFANGGVVSSPTMFPMSGNRTGIMGEKGAEAIMPLKRAANGQLGVQAQTAPATVNIYNQSDSRIETVQRPDGETDVFIRRVNNALRNERTQAGFSSALQRNQSRGVQAS